MPDGSVLVGEIVSRDVGRIRRIRPDGTIETYASGIGSPRGIAIGPDGSLYVTQTNLGTVLRIAPDRSITRFAGTGGQRAARRRRPGHERAAPVADRGGRRAGRQRLRHRRATRSGESDPTASSARSRAASSASRWATAARPPRPSSASSTASPPGPSGELYIGHQDNGSGAGNRIRRVDVGGTITTVAGGGPDPDILGDGGPGTQATIGVPRGMDVGPDGALYFAELRDGGRVRRLGPDGVITTFAGRSAASAGGDRGDRGPALRADLGSVQGVAVAPDGAVYVGHHGDQNFTGLVRRISRPLPLGDGLHPVPRRLAGLRVRRRRAARPHASTA